MPTDVAMSPPSQPLSPVSTPDDSPSVSPPSNSAPDDIDSKDDIEMSVPLQDEAFSDLPVPPSSTLNNNESLPPVVAAGSSSSGNAAARPSKRVSSATAKAKSTSSGGGFLKSLGGMFGNGGDGGGKGKGRAAPLTEDGGLGLVQEGGGSGAGGITRRRGERAMGGGSGGGGAFGRDADRLIDEKEMEAINQGKLISRLP
jgi:hypothetical protein